MPLELYKKDLIVNILEAKLLESYENYFPQGQYNNKFITYLYQYIRDNTYSGEHDQLLRQFTTLIDTNPLFANTTVVESTDRQTYTLTDDTGFTNEMMLEIEYIIKEYFNYSYKLISENRVIIQVKFGWLPQNTTSWLNLLNDECLIDYYIDGITLRPNTHSKLGGPPDSGFVCYRITAVKEYDTVMLLANKDAMGIEEDTVLPKYTVATLLDELEGSKGATLNRIVEFDLTNFFYELGPYSRNYLSAEKSTIIIQVPYEYAVGAYYYLYDVSSSVQIATNNNPDENHQDNFFVAFDNPNFDSMFTKYRLADLDEIVDKIFNHNDELTTTLIQYLLGDFIWRTTDSKIIAYAQNLLNTIFDNSQLVANGVWSDDMSLLVARFKTGAYNEFFDDDVIDKATEEEMIYQYKQITGHLDPNEQLFNEW